MNYRLKPRLVQALQWDGTLEGAAAIALKLKMVWADSGDFPDAKPTDWIVKSGDAVVVLPHDEFARLFEPVEPDAKRPEPPKDKSPRGPSDVGRPA